MAIVLPRRFKTDRDTMTSTTSTGTQADVSDPEGVLGTINSFQEQLKELQDMASSLNTLRAERAEGIQRSAESIEALGSKLGNLLGNVKQMEEKLDFKRESMTETDQELEDLTNEKERLETEAGEIHGQEVEIHHSDLDNEQRFLGFVQEELLRKTAELSHLQNRLQEANHECTSEWNQYKNELQSYEDEKKSYLETLDHLNELTLAKHVGMQTGKESDPSTRDLTERLISHHFNKIQHREAQRQLMTSQIKQKELEDDIGGLMNQKKELWKQCLDLEKCLEDIKDSSEETNMLRPTSAYSNLPEVVEGIPPRHSVSSEELGQVEPQAHHGFMLHRCHKHVNISIAGSVSEENLVSQTTQIDSGAIDIDSDKIDSGRDKNDAMPPPAPDKDQPEPEEDQDGNNDQNEDEMQQQQPTRRHIPDAERMDSGVSMISKLRKRVSGLSNSIRRRNHSPLLASGSTKRPDASGGGGGGGRRRR